MCAEVSPKKQKKAKQLLEAVSEDGSCSFAKALGSVDFHTRERGVQALTVFLRNSQLLTPLAMRKLWKGLFYCFWHSDKAAAQEALAERLAAILPQLSEEVAVHYFEAFMEAMQREWFGIDKLRLDKFLMLVRKFLKQLFVHLQALDWEEEAVEKYTSFLQGVIDHSNEHTAAGLSFHIVDIFVPELLAVVKEGEEKLPDHTLQQFLKTFIEAIASSSRSSLPPRIREGVFEPLIAEFREPSENQPLQLCNVQDLASHVFQTGAKPVVKAKARDILYELSRTLEGIKSKKRKRGEEKPAEDAEAADLSNTLSLNGHAEDSNATDGAEVELERNKEGSKKAKKKQKKKAKVEASNQEEQRLQKPEQATLVKAKSKIQKLGLNSSSIKKAAEVENKSNTMNSPGSSGDRAWMKKKPASWKTPSPGEEVVTKAAERTAAAVEANKRGMTTVNPATPGAPSETSFDSLLKDSVETEAAKQGKKNKKHKKAATHEAAPRESTPQVKTTTPKSPKTDKPPKDISQNCTPAAPKGSAELGSQVETPGSQGKHVRFHLKRNLYFQQGGAVPSPDLRTPDSCRPKGSALKQSSKFSRLGSQKAGTSPPSSAQRQLATEVKKQKPIWPSVKKVHVNGDKRRSI